MSVLVTHLISKILLVCVCWTISANPLHIVHYHNYHKKKHFSLLRHHFCHSNYLDAVAAWWQRHQISHGRMGARALATPPAHGNLRGQTLRGQCQVTPHTRRCYWTDLWARCDPDHVNCQPAVARGGLGHPNLVQRPLGAHSGDRKCGEGCL
jgi:hypothetical protein